MKKNLRRINSFLIPLFLPPLFFILFSYLHPGPLDPPKKNSDLIDCIFDCRSEDNLFQLEAEKLKKFTFDQWMNYLSWRVHWKLFPLFLGAKAKREPTLLSDKEFQSQLANLLPLEHLQDLKTWGDFIQNPSGEKADTLLETLSEPKQFSVSQAHLSNGVRQWLCQKEGTPKNFQKWLSDLEIFTKLFPQESEFKKKELTILIQFQKFNAVRDLAKNPLYQDLITSSIRFEIAMGEKKFWEALAPLFISQYQEIKISSVLGSVITAIGWGVFLLVLFSQTPWKMRVLLCIFGLIGGILSAHFTLMAAVFQDHLFGWEVGDQALLNFFYFFMGVGFREELLKFAFFWIFFQILKPQSARQTLLLGSFVGLGFAVEENLLYFQRGGEVLGRFLTANFLHISLTGFLAHAYFQSKRSPNPLNRENLQESFFLVVALHALYDFFIIDQTFKDFNWLTLVIFIILSQKFLRLSLSEIKETRHLKSSFLFAISLVFSVTLFLALDSKNGVSGLEGLTLGILNNFIILYMFFQEVPDS